MSAEGLAGVPVQRQREGAGNVRRNTIGALDDGLTVGIPA
jgi:hypothetical protein